MATVAGFSDIGKAAGDLLSKGFDLKSTVTINSTAGDGTKMALKTVKDGDKLSGDVKLSKSFPEADVDVNISSGAKVSVTAATSKLYPGLKCSLAGSIPDHTSGKLTLDFKAPHVTTKTVVGLTPNPQLSMAAAFGIKTGIVGADVTYDTAKNALTKWSVGAAYIRPDYSAGIVLADKGETLKATYYHSIDATQKAGCEIVRKLNTESTAFTMGYQKSLESGAVLKARLANSGIAAVSYSFSPAAKTTLNVAGQVDAANLDKNSKIGMSMDVKA
uniref:Voltage-dependent anion channel protein 2 n=1 Tax=Tetraselmis sp. GSL018 TaxID=582737 RepID=A0A061R571_9CHLO